VTLAVHDTSLRKTAKAIGLSPTGLTRFLEGARPQRGTRARLVAFYARWQRERGQSISYGTARAMLDELAGHLPPRLRGEAIRRMVEALDAAGEAGSLPRPPWLTEMREDEASVG
jgi:hypothetical protein